jgi:hypothetical protein
MLCSTQGCTRKAIRAGQCRPCRTPGRVCPCGKTGGKFYKLLCVACWDKANGAKKTCACGWTSGKFIGKICAMCYTQANTKHLYQFIADWKSSGCIDCGFQGEPCQIDPDHVLDGKTFGIARLVRPSTKALERIKAELKLCVPRCKVCHRQVTRQREKDLHKPPTHNHVSKIMREKSQLVLDFKAKHNWQCTDCKRVLSPEDGWHPSVLELDHLPGFEKIASLSVMTRSHGSQFSIADVKAELFKVEPVCGNCHALRTMARGGANHR